MHHSMHLSHITISIRYKLTNCVHMTEMKSNGVELATTPKSNNKKNQDNQPSMVHDSTATHSTAQDSFGAKVSIDSSGISHSASVEPRAVIELKGHSDAVQCICTPPGNSREETHWLLSGGAVSILCVRSLTFYFLNLFGFCLILFW